MCVIPEAVIQNTWVPSLSDGSYNEWEYFGSRRCDAVVRRHIPEIFKFSRRVFLIFMYLWPCIVSKAWRKNTNKMQQYRWFIVNSRCWLLTTVSTCFGQLYAHHQEKRQRATAYGVFAGSVGCGWLRFCGAKFRVWALWRLLLESSSNLHSAHTLQQPSQCSHPTATFTVLTPYNVAPQNRNQPHPTLPAKKPHMQ